MTPTQASLSPARTLRALAVDDRGSTAIEYALIAALVSIAILGGLSALSDSMVTMFNTVNSAM
ncbi:MAG: Flp family type IVb pilin [Alphaproteobacteria bacterium]|nr:Flp family type IVb pilin [Alphaproteobacteria bacterium]MBF0252003.1 Flp family type IVb pilin [Alphaproteobacteria bacterium]